MNRAWAWLKQLWEPEPPPEKFPEDEVAEYVTRIRRKMQNGHWAFSWTGMGTRRLTVMHPNLPYLTQLINRTRTALLSGSKLPVETKQAPHSVKGVEEVTVSQYLANDKGLFKKPEVTIQEFIDATIWFSSAMKEVRANSPMRAETLNNQCTYLYKEIIQVAGALL